MTKPRPTDTLRVAAVQDAPVFLDAAATTQRMLDWIERAHGEGRQLVAFGETFLPGYPFWLSETGGARFEDDRQKACYARYLEAAIEVDGPEIRALEQASHETGIFVVTGVVERGVGEGRGSVYASALCIHPERGCAPSHRKLVPTHEERLVWARGDAHGLRVHEFLGRKISVLNCWENWMPLARHALYAQGSEVHIALWPGAVVNTQSITTHIAREGRVFVVSAGGILRAQDVPDDFPVADALPRERSIYHDGGSGIAAPDGTWLAQPLSTEVGLVSSDLELAMIARERQNFDPSGHYSRPELFTLDVDRRRPQSLRLRD